MRKRRSKLARQRSAERLAALERGSPRAQASPKTGKKGKMPSLHEYAPVSRSNAKKVEVSADPVEPGFYYAFSSQSRRPARRNALVVLFSFALVFFAVFAISKIPFIVPKIIAGRTFEFSANLAAIGVSTGVEVTTRWTFVMPHIIVASSLEILFALIMMKKVRMSTPWVLHSVFALTLIHCLLIIPNWRGLPGPAGNILFVTICIIAAFRLEFFEPKSQLSFSWLVLAVNSGPVGEVGFWIINLRESLLAWRDAVESQGAPADDETQLRNADVASDTANMSTSTAYGALLAFGILAASIVVLVWILVGIYNVWFCTYKYGSVPRKVFSWPFPRR